jgi:hypothetical protein
MRSNASRASPQREIEETRRDSGAGLRIRGRGFAQHALDVLGGDLAAHERQVLDEACEVVEVARPSTRW